MSNTYITSQEILSQIKRIKPDYDQVGCTPALNPENITQILLDFQGLLGENPNFKSYIKNRQEIDFKNNPNFGNRSHDLRRKDEKVRDLNNFHFESGFCINWKTQAEALYLKWFKPNFNQATPSLWAENKEAVLKELLEILKKL